MNIRTGLTNLTSSLEALILRSTSLIKSPIRISLQIREGTQEGEAIRKLKGKKIRRENILNKVERDNHKK